VWGLHSFYSVRPVLRLVGRYRGQVAEDDRGRDSVARSDQPLTSLGQRPRISVVIPAYNSENYISETLDSVRAQTFVGWELVVYDDGSRDATPAVAGRYAAMDNRIRVVRGENGGVAAARNRGFEATDPRSEFVIFLDNDDVWEPDALETLVGVLEGHPEYVSSHSLARCIGDDGLPVPGDDLDERMRKRKAVVGRRVVEVPLLQPTTFAAMALENWIVTPGTLLMRRTVAEAAGGFDERAVPADDWDMAIRVSRIGDIGYVDRPLLRWRRHPGAQSNVTRYGGAYFRVRRKMLSDPRNSPGQVAAARHSFIAVIRSTVREACERLAHQEFGTALRQAAKAGYQVVSLLRAESSVLVRLVIDRRVSAPARGASDSR
jgi:glycosyltransferase involved in cell wall biosynthesis